RRVDDQISEKRKVFSSSLSGRWVLQPVGAIDSVNKNISIKEFGFAFDFLAESFRDSDRRGVVWIDEADDMISIQIFERITKSPFRCFRSITASPELAPERPAQLKAR